MGFEAIENVAKPPASKVPADGVLVSSRAAARNGRYIAIAIGPELAKDLCLNRDEVGMRCAFGTGRDAGMIGLSVDASGGAFLARRQKSGKYLLTINQRSAAGMFALDFPAFTVRGVETVSRQGEPPMAVFAASKEMLEADDD